jgi:hypothetical protein
MCGRQHSTSESLEIAHAQGVGRAGNARGILLRPGIAAPGGSQRAGRQKTQKLVAWIGSGLWSLILAEKKSTDYWEINMVKSLEIPFKPETTGSAFCERTSI